MVRARCDGGRSEYGNVILASQWWAQGWVYSLRHALNVVKKETPSFVVLFLDLCW